MKNAHSFSVQDDLNEVLTKLSHHKTTNIYSSANIKREYTTYQLSVPMLVKLNTLPMNSFTRIIFPDNSYDSKVSML